MENMDIKCGYCSFVIARNYETACRHFPLHSCLAAYDHVTIDSRGIALAYEGDGDAEYANNENTENTEDNLNKDCFESAEQNDKWTHEAVLLLINAYEEQQEKFMSPMYNKKQVWQLISNELKKHNVQRCPKKCDEKRRNLKKHYEKIVRSNDQTGSDRKTWIYFKPLHNILFKNPGINPIATCSSTGIINIRKDAVGNVGEKRNEKRENTESDCSSSTPKKKKKHETREEARERRHREKMEQKEKFFQWYKNYMEKK